MTSQKRYLLILSLALANVAALAQETSMAAPAQENSTKNASPANENKAALTTEQKELQQLRQDFENYKRDQEKLQKEAEAEKQHKSDNNQNSLSYPDWLEAGMARVSTSGFASAFFSKANKDIDATGVDPTTGIGLSDQWSVKPDLIFGVQTNYQVTHDTEAVVQLTAEGKDNLDVEAKWAYIRYELNSDLFLRVGRVRIPFYLYSESLDIGYTYPWVRPPIELYLTAFSTYEGIDLQWNFLTGDWANEIHVAFSSFDSRTIKVNDAYFFGWSISKDYWSIRGAVQYSSKVKLLLEKNLLPDAGTDSTIYSSLGVRYDDGGLFMITEFAYYDVNDKIPNIGQTNAIFCMGQRFGKWMPFFTLAKGYSTESQEDNMVKHGIPPTLAKSHYAQQSVGVGLRYDINEALVFKAEYVHYNHFEDGGNFGVTNEFAILDQKKLDELGDSISIMSFGFDLLF